MGLGIFGVWGPVLQRDDYLTLSSFADEVSAAIQKAWLIADLNALKTFNEEIVQGLAELILKIDSDGTVTFANPAICKLLGISPQSLIGQKWTALIPPDEQKRLLETINHLENDSITGIETIVINQQGRHIPVLVGIQAQRKESIFSGAIISITDIAARVMAENQVRASEREKEALLKEIHHRVKNNLQIISSLLNLQASCSKDPQVEGILQESKSRVRAMALIHEKLYKSSNMDRINFVEYIHNLAETLNQAYGNRSIPVQIYIQADLVFMDIDTAIPCGLIMNELITNSLKHAFSERNGDHSDEMAWIKIELKGITDTRVRLIVSDNGAGFPPNFNYTKQETLGVKLINSLVRQIDGNLTFINHDGARVEIEIPVKYPIYATGEKEDD